MLERVRRATEKRTKARSERLFGLKKPVQALAALLNEDDPTP